MHYIILFLILTVIVYVFILIIKGEKLVVVRGPNISIGVISNISKQIEDLKRRNILLKGMKFIKPINIFCISVALFILSVTILNFLIGVLSTSIILSFPVLISPVIISQILIKNNKRKVLASLPMYAVNLKNYITEDNNIVSAIMKSSAEPPLIVFISKFKNNILRGMNVLQALEILDKDVGVEKFSELIEVIKLCYISGGNFVSVLEKYIAIITKEATYKEQTEEKAFSSIITLLVMIVLNVIVIVFILKNNGYGNIIRNTFVGKTILNFNAISYMVIAGLVGKIYKEE